MAQPSKIARRAECHEELFLSRYRRLSAWAVQLTQQNRERAEDLVHDAYIQFTYTRPDLDSINNLDAYLYSMLRNLHLSQVRRTLRQAQRTLSIVDYDSAEIGLRVADPREQIRLQDELRQVCQYACLRKETSKAGSVLLLRFMHGYYPREIAQLMRSTRQAVEERLRIARTEARQFLENPGSLRFIRETTAERPPRASEMGFARTSEGLLQELRHRVFDSCRGSCLASEQMEKLYHAQTAQALDHLTLGHIVSCPQCLDAANRLLRLPLLAERFPTDTLGTDTQSKGGGGDDDGEGGEGGGSAMGGSDEAERVRRRCRKRAREVFEHKPAELCISVNGYLMAAQRVSSEVSEQTLTINVAERIDFIEIFSEQDVRLLFVSVEELPPGGAYERSTSVRLSDERALEATLSFTSPWPTLHVIYRDPLLNNEGALRLDTTEEEAAGSAGGGAAAAAEAETVPEFAGEGERRQSRSRLAGFLRAWASRLWRGLINPGFWLRPATITALVSLVLIAALLLTRVQRPVTSAAELLRRSAVAEETVAVDAAVVLHRTINLEERRVQGGEMIARRRIEVWQSAARGIRLRRIYDAEHGLIAGEWTRSDGTSTVYRRDAAPQARTAPEVAARAILETGELWRLDASARDFNALVGPTEAVTVEQRAGTYVLDYRGEAVSGAHAAHLRRATLTLNRADLHAVEQTLVIERDGEAREYRFVEAGFERRPADSIAPSLFEPEPELSGGVASAKDGEVDKVTKDGPELLASVHAQPAEAVAAPELEIEVTYLLNRIKADLGEQVSMTRTGAGALQVEAIVESEARKTEILRALAPVINNPAVRVEVSTVAEAVRRRRDGSNAQGVTTREVEVRNNRIPADAELRSYFSARLAGSSAVDQEINRYAGRVMSRSRQALLHASALERLVRRFSPEEIGSLAPEAQSKWRSMIREHAQAYEREVASLGQELRPVFKGSGEGAVETTKGLAPSQAAARLLTLSYANDEAVRSAFTISTDERAALAVKTGQFWRSLDGAQKLAAAIEAAYR